MNLVDVLQKVTEVNKLGLQLGVPKRELEKIRQDFRKVDEQKREVLQWWLDHTLNPTWEKVIGALEAMHRPVLADAVAEVSKRGSLYEPPTEYSQKWEENFKKIDSFDQKLQDVQQRSRCLEEEWEKCEKEWQEDRIKLKKIEEDWEDLVKSQRTDRAFLTLGIALLFQSNLEPLQKYHVKELKLQQHMARGKEVKGCYEKAKQHQRELEDAEKELKEWKVTLVKEELELNKRINQMEQLGEKFLGEAQEHRKQLEKSRERLQTRKNKMCECCDELRSQLQKCQEKLEE